jgi:co-chaperonin GroES (HSP10)
MLFFTGKYAGTEIKFDDKDYLIMREDDILLLKSKTK